MKILITGGAGFIGGHLAEALIAAGNEVAVLDNFSTGSDENVPAGAQVYRIDIRDSENVKSAIEEFQPDVICHQAAQVSVSRSVREPGLDADTNILGLINICHAGVQHGVKKIVFASSGGVLYGETLQPAPEETPANPISPYGISKWAGEKYLEFFCREHGISAIGLRYANVYGERQNPEGEAGVVAIFCTRLLKGEQAVINGDGGCTRDYVHVSDVVAANLKAIQHTTQGFECFNVGTGVGTDVNELAEVLRQNCIKQIQQRGISVTIQPFAHGPERAGDLRCNLVSSAKAAQVLGWSPQISFEAGAQRTCQWFADKILN